MAIDLKDHLQRAVDRPVLSAQELDAIARRARRLRRRTRVRLFGGVVVCCIAPGAITVFAIPKLTDSTHKNPQIVATPSPRIGNTPGLPPAPARPTLQVLLPGRTFVAGSTVNATAVVTNPNTAPLTVTGCGNLFEAILSNGSAQQSPGWFLCRQSINIPSGRSSYPLRINTSYTGCGAAPSPFPECLPTHQPPPLPAGTYQLTVAATPGFDIQTPPALNVRVVSPTFQPRCPRGYAPGQRRLAGRCVPTNRVEPLLDGLDIRFIRAATVPAQDGYPAAYRINARMINTTQKPRRVPDFGIFCETNTEESTYLPTSTATPGSVLAAHSDQTVTLFITYSSPCQFPLLMFTALGTSDALPKSIAVDLHHSD